MVVSTYEDQRATWAEQGTARATIQAIAELATHRGTTGMPQFMTGGRPLAPEAKPDRQVSSGGVLRMGRSSRLLSDRSVKVSWPY